MQEELDALESKISETRGKIQSRQSSSRVQRQRKAELGQRIAHADNLLAVAAQEARSIQPRLTSALPDSSNMVRMHRSFENVRNSRARQRKRPIDSFRAHCPLFVESCLQGLTGRSTGPDFNFSDTLSSHKASMAVQTGMCLILPGPHPARAATEALYTRLMS